MTLLSRAASSSFRAEQSAAVKSWGAGSRESGVGGFHGNWWPYPAHLCLRQSGEGVVEERKVPVHITACIAWRGRAEKPGRRAL